MFAELLSVRRIIESLRLEKTSEIIRFDCQPIPSMAVGQELCLQWELGHSQGAFLVGKRKFGVWVKENGKFRERPLDLLCGGLGITRENMVPKGGQSLSMEEFRTTGMWH